MKVPGVEGSEDVWPFQRDNRDPTPEVNMKGMGGGVGTQRTAQSMGDNSAGNAAERSEVTRSFSLGRKQDTQRKVPDSQLLASGRGSGYSCLLGDIST